MKEYYFNEVFKLKQGGWEFGAEEDTNAYTYKNDQDVINGLTSKLGGEYEYIETTKVQHPVFNENVHTLVFFNRENNMYQGVYTFSK